MINFYKNKNAKEVMFSFDEINDENYVLLKANSVDAAKEKHVPVYEIIDDKINVKVGDILHPMSEEHYIMWIALVTEDNIQITRLKPTDKPNVTFNYINNARIYAYCNLHGLWVNEIK